MTIAEILALPPEERRAAYAVVNGIGVRNGIDISSVWIKRNAYKGDVTDDFTDNDKFTNYGTYSFVWHRSDKESMERTDDASLPQLWDMPYFILGHLKIDFDIMSIDDYRRIMKLVYGGVNSFKVKTYDIVYDRMIIIEMYFYPDELPKIFTMAERLHGIGASSEEWTDLIAVQSHTVEMVGSNNDHAQQKYFG